MKKYLISTLIIVFAINLSFAQGLNLATDELLSEFANTPQWSIELYTLEK